MKAYISEIPEDKDYIVLTILKSDNSFVRNIKVPKYFLTEDSNLKVGSRVIINVQYMETK